MQVTVVGIEADTDPGGELVVLWKRQDVSQHFYLKQQCEEYSWLTQKHQWKYWQECFSSVSLVAYNKTLIHKVDNLLRETVEFSELKEKRSWKDRNRKPTLVSRVVCGHGECFQDHATEIIQDSGVHNRRISALRRHSSFSAETNFAWLDSHVQLRCLGLWWCRPGEGREGKYWTVHLIVPPGLFGKKAR